MSYLVYTKYHDCCYNYCVYFLAHVLFSVQGVLSGVEFLGSSRSTFVCILIIHVKE